ncbi:MAG: DivIVA domain-containing protein [marine benthic group bacterium]|nr:DivIVA domain-containing protein [Gemmatimonadota bacterium]MCL7937933.1 DivIVA domain-containing protein [Gemmatimonadota bacterium]MCL7967534.1 DivIVA domain-containing protein [Gemmatimonadota bacterium]MCL7968925.1 DivIVA domain-containing protein [Gemmatimonadota bacterium]MCL7977280.1 DivIVA domain-containing protein [Gemmatimonadota bacterium]
MIDLTPLDVRKKKDDFRRAVRGYDPAQVDGFLDLVADRLEDLVGRELRLREQSDLLKEQLAAFQEREKALNEALVTAQELREEARAQAEKTADLRVREAERQAREIRRDAESAVQGARRGLDDLRVRRAGFLRSLRSTIEHFLAEIEDEEKRGFAGLDIDTGEESEDRIAGPPEEEALNAADGDEARDGGPAEVADPDGPHESNYGG